MPQIARRRIGGAALAVLALASPAGAASLPPAVTSYVKEIEGYCTAGVAARAEVKTAAFNDDGEPDYLVDEGTLRCADDALPPYCGATGYCSFRVFVSAGQGFRTEDFSARDYAVGRGILTVEGRRLRWNGTAFKRR